MDFCAATAHKRFGEDHCGLEDRGLIQVRAELWPHRCDWCHFTGKRLLFRDAAPLPDLEVVEVDGLHILQALLFQLMSVSCHEAHARRVTAWLQILTGLTHFDSRRKRGSRERPSLDASRQSQASDVTLVAAADAKGTPRPSSL